MTVDVSGVSLNLVHADEIQTRWIGQDEPLRQLLASWYVVDATDVPMNPRLIGRPGVGKTTLACAAAARLGRDAYILQATCDTNSEDLLIAAVTHGGSIRYAASPLVTAMIRGGVCILDEASRMPEKSWASLVPLLDSRRHIESALTGLKIKAHPLFRLVATMNDDSSTFDLPDYIHSRLQPQILIDFPEHPEEGAILRENLPFAEDQILDYVTEFLQRSHSAEERFTVRDGINAARYAMKLRSQSGLTRQDALDRAFAETLGDDAIRLRARTSETEGEAHVPGA